MFLGWKEEGSEEGNIDDISERWGKYGIIDEGRY